MGNYWKAMGALVVLSGALVLSGCSGNSDLSGEDAAEPSAEPSAEASPGSPEASPSASASKQGKSDEQSGEKDEASDNSSAAAKTESKKSDKKTVDTTIPEGAKLPVPGKVKVPSQWPKSVPLYKKGELETAVADQNGTTLVWNTSKSVPVVFKSYQKSLKRSGFSQSKGALVISEGSRIRASTFNDKKTTVSVAVTGSGKNTVLSVTAGAKQ